MVRSEDETVRVHQVHCELTLPVPGELMATDRLLDRDQPKMVGTFQNRHAEYDRPRHAVAVPVDKFTLTVELPLELAGPEPDFQGSPTALKFITQLVTIS